MPCLYPTCFHLVDRTLGPKKLGKVWGISFVPTITISGMRSQRYQRSLSQTLRISEDSWKNVIITPVTTWVTWPQRWWCFWREQQTAWLNWSPTWQMKSAKWKRLVSFTWHYDVWYIINILSPVKYLAEASALSTIILYQWIALKACSDWLLKYQISFVSMYNTSE